ncbi:molybdenum cofactor guanylyltransferase [Agromyces sp. SYSU T00194]|uniref:molybdenum cofactor guanylyltransferase n=1 Tax=Agromyces chitinivorans TaxID=3158560 RepID=UPI003396433A
MSEVGTYDAVVLAGGRGSRLGGVEKPLLRRRGRSLLDGVLDAVTDASRIVVVGPPSLAAHVAGHTLVREDPPLGGPVPAIAAGLAALPARDAPVVLLAADLVDPAAAVAALVAAYPAVVAPSAAAAETVPHEGIAAPGSVRPEAHAAAGTAQGGPTSDGVIAVDPDGRRQPLLAIYRGPALRDALTAQSALGPLDGLPLRRLIDPLDLTEVPLPADALRDLDTAADAAQLGVDLDPGHPPA